MTLLVYLPCWALYWTGHLASLVVNRMDDSDSMKEPGRLFNAMFWLYQKPMSGSFRLQRWAEGDPPTYSTILPWQPPRPVND